MYIIVHKYLGTWCNLITKFIIITLSKLWIEERFPTVIFFITFIVR